MKRKSIYKYRNCLSVEGKSLSNAYVSLILNVNVIAWVLQQRASSELTCRWKDKIYGWAISSGQCGLYNLIITAPAALSTKLNNEREKWNLLVLRMHNMWVRRTRMIPRNLPFTPRALQSNASCIISWSLHVCVCVHMREWVSARTALTLTPRAKSTVFTN